MFLRQAPHAPSPVLRHAPYYKVPTALRRSGPGRAGVAPPVPRRGAPAPTASALRSVCRAVVVPGAPHGDLQLCLSLRDGFPMKTFLRQLVVCALPLFFAAGSGYYFTTIHGSFGAMVCSP